MPGTTACAFAIAAMIRIETDHPVNSAGGRLGGLTCPGCQKRPLVQ